MGCGPTIRLMLPLYFLPTCPVTSATPTCADVNVVVTTPPIVTPLNGISLPDVDKKDTARPSGAGCPWLYVIVAVTTAPTSPTVSDCLLADKCMTG